MDIKVKNGKFKMGALRHRELLAVYAGSFLHANGCEEKCCLVTTSPSKNSHVI